MARKDTTKPVKLIKGLSPKAEYDVHPGVEMMREWLSTIEQKTGKNIAAWTRVAKSAKKEKQNETAAWLKSEHKLPTMTAWHIAAHSHGEPLEADADEYLAQAQKYIEAMYEHKQSLLPIHHAIVTLVRSSGYEIKICPCKTIVPIYREHVIAQIKPTTKTRIDFGLCLKHVTKCLPAYVIDTGGLAKKDRITHRIELGRVEDVDSRLEEWFKVAWDGDS